MEQKQIDGCPEESTTRERENVLEECVGGSNDVTTVRDEEIVAIERSRFRDPKARKHFRHFRNSTIGTNFSAYRGILPPIVPSKPKAG